MWRLIALLCFAPMLVGGCAQPSTAEQQEQQQEPPVVVTDELTVRRALNDARLRVAQVNYKSLGLFAANVITDAERIRFSQGTQRASTELRTAQFQYELNYLPMALRFATYTKSMADEMYSCLEQCEANAKTCIDQMEAVQ